MSAEQQHTVIGLVTYLGAVAGLEIQDVTYGESGSTVEPMTEGGCIDRIAIYGKKKTIAVNGNVKQGADLAALTIGGTLTVDSVAYTITSVSIKESVTGAKSCSVNGEAPWPAAAAAAPSGESNERGESGAE